MDIPLGLCLQRLFFAVRVFFYICDNIGIRSVACVLDLELRLETVGKVTQDDSTVELPSLHILIFKFCLSYDLLFFAIILGKSVWAVPSYPMALQQIWTRFASDYPLWI